MRNELTKRLNSIQGMKFGRENRYTCRDCSDTGWVTIFRPATIRAAIANHDLEYWETCVCLCSCSSADQNGQEFRVGPRRGCAKPVFGSQRWHINARGPDAKAAAVGYVHHAEGYNDDLASWEAP